ncbi:MAG: DEAD/DEAH box helicase, partial [Tagaea sp.]
MTASLPIETALPELLAALAARPNAVLEAPPGAGKTTRVPLALLGADWAKDGKILVLEPRRIAARVAARRMAQTLGENVAETVGYRVRLDSRVGPNTRVEVVTDGLFVRRIQNDPALDGVAALLFDEFHERGLESDMG